MRESPSFDETFQKQKKAVVIVAAVVIILLGGRLVSGQVDGLIGSETPLPTAVAAITTLPPTTTALLTMAPTGTPSSVAISTPPPADTVYPPTVTSQPPTPTLPPPPTAKLSTPTPSPSPTPQPPTPTLPPSPTLPPPTPTPSLTATLPSQTATPATTSVTRYPLVIVNPVDGSQLPSDALIVEGTAEPGTTVAVHEDNISLGEATADEAGNWSLIPAKQLAAGEHTIVVLDVAAGEASAPVTFTLLQAWLPITGNE